MLETERPTLWRRPAFRRFWLGEGISFLGNQVTELALPLTAVTLLGATADQMGILAAAWFLPYLVFGLLAGVWVDRMSRRRILVATDLVSAVAVAAVPVAWWLGALRIELLYVVAFALGSAVVLFTVAYQSYVPTLVGREDVARANAALEATSSVTTVAGPGIGGLIVQALGAPVALAVDAVSFLVSAVLVGSIHVAEPPLAADERRSSTLEQVREGIRYVRSSPLLAALVRGGTTHNFFSRMMDALFVLFASRELALSPAAIGLVLTVGGPGALLGSLAANGLAARFGVGRTIVGAQILTGVARLLVPLAGGPTLAAAATLAASTFLLGAARTVFNVNQLSLRLAITPDRMHGRLNATMRFVMWGVTPFGALAGGFLAASAVGMRTTLLIAAAGILAATLPLLARPLRDRRSIVEVARPDGV